MFSVQEVEAALGAMPQEQRQQIYRRLITQWHCNAERVSSIDSAAAQHILDVPPISVGGLKVPFQFSREELYDDMLGDRL